MVQPSQQKHLSYPAVLVEYITRTRGLAYADVCFVPKIRDFESNGMDRGTKYGWDGVYFGTSLTWPRTADLVEQVEGPLHR